MIPEISHFALILALCVSLVQGVLPLIGAHRGNPGWVALARPAAWALALVLVIAFAGLTTSFVQNDFSVRSFPHRKRTGLQSAKGHQ